MKRSGISVGAKSLERGSTFKPPAQGLARSSGLVFGGGGRNKRGKGISPASKIQRDKVKLYELRCRACKQGSFTLDPAHVIDRSIGGCDEMDCVVPLCRSCHDAYDTGTPQLDLLPYLSLEEQAHAVGHLGLTRALRRITGERRVP